MLVTMLNIIGHWGTVPAFKELRANKGDRYRLNNNTVKVNFLNTIKNTTETGQ